LRRLDASSLVNTPRETSHPVGDWTRVAGRITHLLGPRSWSRHRLEACGSRWSSVAGCQGRGFTGHISCYHDLGDNLVPLCSEVVGLVNASQRILFDL
jgi:hypothetical protein